ncbi:MAG: glycosyltransferase family 4 protein, partial [Kiritimatiellaeota bacterium]|nr:glycosyltransferase family 4 protein [Kiritimatiellota bacterium]
EFSPDIAVCMRDVSRALFQRQLASMGAPVAVFWDNPRIIRTLKYYPLETMRVRFAPPAGFTPYCSSNEIAASLKSAHGLSDVTVIPNCYDQRRFHLAKHNSRGSSDQLRIISIGSDRPEKNHADKIEIARRLKSAEMDFSLTIVGQGVDTALKALAKSAGVEAETRLLGERNDIPAILAESDIFLSTSTSEGMPVSLLEAMASGIPCVVYAFPSLNDINIEDSLVDAVPLGDVDTAVERILFWRGNPDKALEFGAKASANVAERFASTTSAARWEEFLKNVAKLQ